MKDREAVLRYLAFRLFDYQTEYHSDMSRFVEDAMRKMNKMSAAEISTLRADFERVMKRTYEFFGTRNFRVPLTGKPNTRGRINIAVLESVGHFFSVQQDDFLRDHKSEIMANFDRLLKDKDYLDAVQKSTGDKNRVITRFQLAQTLLGEVNSN